MNIYYHIKNAITNAWYDFRSRCQRFKRGWAYEDVWDIDAAIAAENEKKAMEENEDA